MPLYPESETTFASKGSWRIVDFYLKLDDLAVFSQLVQSAIDTSEYRTYLDGKTGVGYSLERLMLMPVLLPSIILLTISGYIIENKESTYYQDLIAFTIKPQVGNSYMVSGASAQPVAIFFNYVLVCFGTYFPETKQTILNYFKRIQTVHQAIRLQDNGRTNSKHLKETREVSDLESTLNLGYTKMPRSTTLKAVALARYYVEKRLCPTIHSACIRAHTSLVSYRRYYAHQIVETHLKLFLGNQNEVARLQSFLTNSCNRRKKHIE